MVEVCGIGSDRGEEGEYHHCDSLSKRSRGGKRGGNFENRVGFVGGYRSARRIRNDVELTISSIPFLSMRRPSHVCHGR